ncbi:MAG: enoyl-ACP reductase FabI [Thermomicrobiales bacterium]
MGQLDGQTGLVFGVANKRSIAWGIAQALHREGMRLAFTYQGDRLEAGVRELAESLDPTCPVVSCDVTSDDDIAAVFAAVGAAFGGGLDTLVHAVAFAPRESFAGQFLDTARADFAAALDISAYSLVALARAAAPLMDARGGGSILTMTYLGGERVVPRYNLMGVAKAALDSAVTYLAYDLGPRNIRVNAISAGPVRTLAGRSIPGFPRMEEYVRVNAPLKRNVDIDDIGLLAAFLAGPGGQNISGEVIHLDAGYHVMGMGGPLE